MSLIDDLIILLDEFPKIDLDLICKELPNKSKQIISSGLGRLTAKGLIDKIKKDKKIFYKLNKLGHQKIDQSLKGLSELKNINTHKYWQVVIFDIPEKNRKLRDDLRNYLTSEAFGRLHSSIWMSYIDKMKKVNGYLLDHNLKDKVTIFYTNKFDVSEEKSLAAKLHWPWNEINNQYKLFINNAQKFLKSRNKNSYAAKRLVLNFANSLRYDPKLPENLQPKNHLLSRATKFYQQIREYCYNK